MAAPKVSARTIVIAVGMALLVLVFILALRAKPAPDAALQAACEGPPLRSVEKREKALQDGYRINAAYDCIDKASFAAVAEARARWEAANTPEAKARAAAERAKKIAQEQDAAAVKALTPEPFPEPAPLKIRLLDVNTASAKELAEITGISLATAAEIVEERKRGGFSNWTDLVNRVAGLSSAKNAVLASMGGLTVEGDSLPGVPPDPSMAVAPR